MPYSKKILQIKKRPMDDKVLSKSICEIQNKQNFKYLLEQFLRVTAAVDNM